MAEELRPKSGGNTNKRQELIRESIAKSKQFSSDFKELKNWDGWKTLSYRTRRFLNRRDTAMPEPPQPYGKTNLLDPVKFKRLLIRIVQLLVAGKILSGIIDAADHADWWR